MTENQNAEEVRGYSPEELAMVRMLSATGMASDSMTENHQAIIRRLLATIATQAEQLTEAQQADEESRQMLDDVVAERDQLQAEVMRLQTENKEQFAILEESVRLGSEQAEEYDRFWEAMGVCSEDITVDDAIAKYQQLQTELHDVRSELSMVQDELQTAQQVIVEHCPPKFINERWECVCEGRDGARQLQHADDCAWVTALRAQHDRIEAQHQASRQALAADASAAKENGL